MITQAFRYAYEPFVFAQSKNKDKNETYAIGMKYFLIFTLLAFLCVVAYLPLLKYMVGSDYWEGLRVIPIVMAAEIMMGIYFNLSFWYKLIDKTIYGAWFSLAGCAVLFAVNIIFIPHYSYMACAGEALPATPRPWYSVILWDKERIPSTIPLGAWPSTWPSPAFSSLSCKRCRKNGHPSSAWPSIPC